MNLSLFIAKNPLIFHAAIILFSFIILVKSADMLVFGIDRYAKKEGLSDYFIGLIVVSITASAPEFVSGITGLFAGDNGIVFGTILGSNIAGITLVLGVFALIGRKIKLENKVLTKMEVILFFLISLPFLLGTDGELSRVDGIVLVVIFMIYAAVLWKKEVALGKVKKDVKLKKIWQDALIYILAFAALVLSSRWLVFSSIEAAKMIGLSTYIIAVAILGIASSLPDMFVGIRALLEGDVGVGIGGSLGSMIVKMLLFFGAFAIIQPLPVDMGSLMMTIGVTIFSLAIVLFLSERGEMSWKHGLFLIFIYFGYIIAEVLKAFSVI